MANDKANVPIYDNVHGFITLTDAEHKIINSTYFQRLREIKQLSFAYFVFAGAVHTRFSHSLGVLAIVIKILQHLQRNPVIGADITLQDIKLLRMAALLHDIGHYPLSHMVESAYKELHHELRSRLQADDEAGVEFDPEAAAIIRDTPLLAEEIVSVNGHHESLGSYIINNTNISGGITSILKSFDFSDEDIREIGLIICGKSSTTWYNQILHSELDADRLDYLLRDSHSTGVHYGNFDFDYLLNNLRLVIDPTSKNKVFCIKASALFTVEHYLLARYFWYAQIICDRKIAIFDHIGQDVYKWLVSKSIAYDYTKILQTVQNPLEFFKFNDNYYWNHIYSLINDQQPQDKFYAEMAEMLVTRKSFKRLKIPTQKQLCHCCPCPTDCAKLGTCEHSIKSSREEIELYDATMNNLVNTFNRCRIDVRYAAKIHKNVFISKRFADLQADEQERDPIRILEAEDDIRLLNKMSHSVISHLSKYELFLPRIYVHEKYWHFAQYIVDSQ